MYQQINKKTLQSNIKGRIMRKTTSLLGEDMHEVASIELAKKHNNLPDGYDEDDYEPEDNYYSSDEEEDETTSKDEEPEFDNLDDFDDDFYDDDDDDF